MWFSAQALRLVCLHQDFQQQIPVSFYNLFCKFLMLHLRIFSFPFFFFFFLWILDIFYVLLKGTDGLVHTKLRSEGVIQAMKDAGLNVTEKAVVEAEYDRNTAKSEMDTVLPGLKYDCIIANNDAMAIGAIMAMEDAGTDPASVPVVGIDATEDARELIELVGDLNCHINLIPVNPIEERDFRESTAEAIRAFQMRLEKHKLNVTVRREMGRDIDGACGQLRRRHKKEM